MKSTSPNLLRINLHNEIWTRVGRCTIGFIGIRDDVAATMLAATALVPTAARAQGNVEAEMIGFHQLCDKGDRRACVRFGILIGQNQ
jgi:hypothetical protein